MSIKQKTKNVTLDDGTIITVKRMNWMNFQKFARSVARVACEFKDDNDLLEAIKNVMKSISSDSKELSTEQVLFSLAPALDAVLGALQKLFELAPELVDELILGSSDLTPEAYVKVQEDWCNPLRLMDAALEVNYDYEVKNCFSGLVNRFGKILSSNPKKK